MFSFHLVNNLFSNRLVQIVCGHESMDEWQWNENELTTMSSSFLIIICG